MLANRENSARQRKRGVSEMVKDCCNCESRLQELERQVDLNNELMRDLYLFIERELGAPGLFVPEEAIEA